MALRLRSAQSEYAQSSNMVAAPINASFACWVYPFSLSADMTIMEAGDHTVAIDRHRLRLYYRLATNTVNADYCDSFSQNSAVSAAAALRQNAWNFLACSFTPSTINVWVNGTLATVSHTGFTVNTYFVNIGRSRPTTPSAYFDGIISQPCIWNSVLTTNNVASMLRGLHPRTVQPASVAAFWNLNGPIISIEQTRNRAQITQFGGSVVDEAPLTQPFIQSRRLASDAGISGGSGSGSSVILMPLIGCG